VHLMRELSLPVLGFVPSVPQSVPEVLGIFVRLVRYRLPPFD
jgi:hypothetical protein